MSATLASEPQRWRDRLRAWHDRTLADPGFRAWAARFPLTRPVARRRARALFDLCAGFVYAQTLAACVTLDVFETLARQGPLAPERLVPSLPPGRAALLCDSAAALGLLRRAGDDVALGPLGAALVGNDGVLAMIRHHAMLYRDLADPVALLRDPNPDTLLARYWRYGTDRDPAALSPDQTAPYTRLMAASQPLVAAEILAAYDVGRHRRLLDIGGGDGSFALAARARAPHLEAHVFDLPPVAARAAARGLAATGGDMRAESLPRGFDLATLVRVIHDHDDPAAAAILANARRALAPRGTLLLAEPMLDAPGAEPVGAYFALYLTALGSGRPRRQRDLVAMLRSAGFSRIRPRRTGNPLLTSLIVARA